MNQMIIPFFREGDLVHVTPPKWVRERPTSPYGIVITSKDTESKWESRAASIKYWVFIDDKVWNFCEGELSAVIPKI